MKMTFVSNLFLQTTSEEQCGEVLFSLCYMPASGRLAFVALKGKNLKPQETRKAGGKFIHNSIQTFLPYMHYLV